jgi:hydroxymethylbilane synthase
LAAGCSAPVGAYAAGTEILQLRAVVAALDGGSALRASATAPAAEAGRLGRDVAAELLRQGAATYVAVSSEYISNGDDAS